MTDFSATLCSAHQLRLRRSRVVAFALCIAFLWAARLSNAQPGESKRAPAKSAAELERDLASMLSGATLEGSFTVTGRADSDKLSREKYTLGEVKKLEGNLWLIPARIEYGDHDVTIPLTLPIEWAGDTPVVVVDEVGLPGFGTVSARVMFFADHYAGYWAHGEAGGHLFGTIHRKTGD